MELMDGGTMSYEFFRMLKNSFNLMLSKLECHLKEQDTHWRKAITLRKPNESITTKNHGCEI